MIEWKSRKRGGRKSEIVKQRIERIINSSAPDFVLIFLVRI